MKHESTDYFISHYWGVPPPRRYNCHPELHEGRGQAVRCYPRKKMRGIFAAILHASYADGINVFLIAPWACYKLIMWGSLREPHFIRQGLYRPKKKCLHSISITFAFK